MGTNLFYALPRLTNDWAIGRNPGFMAYALANAGPDGVEILVSSLTNSSSSVDVRISCIAALCQYKYSDSIKKRILPGLIVLTAHPHKILRDLSISALGWAATRPDDVSATLLNLAEREEDYMMRITVLRSIRTAGMTDANTLAVLERISQNDTNEHVRKLSSQYISEITGSRKTE
jgi:hypothetical protein